MTKRHIYLFVVCVLVCISWIATKVAIRSTTFGKSGSHDHWLNTSGMRTLSTILTVYQSAHSTNAVISFNCFFALIKSELPDAVGNIDDSNPFPGILPFGHKYSRILEMPRNLAPNTIPLLWDTEPGYEGFFAMICWDGSVPELMDIKKLTKTLDEVTQRGGVISTGRRVDNPEQEDGSKSKIGKEK